MSIFKIKIVKIPRDSEERWRMKSVHSGRTEKICEHCKKKIDIGASSITFSKKVISKEGYVAWLSKYTHVGECTYEIQKKLKAVNK